MTTEENVSKDEVIAILVKYIEHVTQCEGVDFLNQINTPVSDVAFSEKEVEFINYIEGDLQILNKF